MQLKAKGINFKYKDDKYILKDIDFTIDSPIPLPSHLLERISFACPNQSNINSNLSFGIPTPLSYTDTTTSSFTLFKDTYISPLSSVYLIAFDNKFNITLSILSGSQANVISSTSVLNIRFIFLCLTYSAIDKVISSITFTIL